MIVAYRAQIMVSLFEELTQRVTLLLALSLAWLLLKLECKADKIRMMQFYNNFEASSSISASIEMSQDI